MNIGVFLATKKAGDGLCGMSAERLVGGPLRCHRGLAKPRGRPAREKPTAQETEAQGLNVGGHRFDGKPLQCLARTPRRYPSDTANCPPRTTFGICSGGSVPVLETDHTRCIQLDHGDSEQVIVAVDRWPSKRAPSAVIIWGTVLLCPTLARRHLIRGAAPAGRAAATTAGPAWTECPVEASGAAVC
jgi:hypothetical protein